MKKIFTVLLFISLLLQTVYLYSADKKAAAKAKPAVATKTEIVMVTTGPTSFSFRAGKLLSAEVTNASPSIKNLSKFDPSYSMKDKAYAALVLSLDKGRSVSSFDYVLKDRKGNLYPCVAVRDGADGPFDASKSEHKGVESKKYTLLFIVNPSTVGKDPLVKYALKSKLVEDAPDVSDIPFRNLISKSFSPGSGIPEKGNIGVYPQEKKVEVKPAPAPAKKPEAKKTDPKSAKK
ncbi:MAG: hypothetical protein A2017_12350 [Lentisphaerae bacterium GWF2_44_16]|nr:MAG: hypothetical protein A2017_12350 [Lentisphaerae bacterium GWF2_44_16]